MANYVKATNFYTKDALLTGNPDKIIKGSEIDAEYNAIATAIGSKADTTSPTFTGTPLSTTAAAGNNTNQIATTAFVETALTSFSSNLGDMALQEPNAVAITGGTVAATFTGNLTGNVTGNVTGTVSGNAGTVTNGVYTTNFNGANKSLGANGYQKFPSGLIMQWGTFTGHNGGWSSVNVTFPIPFPSATVNVHTTIQAGQLGNTEGSLTVNTISTTGFTSTSGLSGAFSVYFLAIGY
jgi:hypothetical protein